MSLFLRLVMEALRPGEQAALRKVEEQDRVRRDLARKMDVQLGRLSRTRLERELAAVEGRMRGRS